MTRKLGSAGLTLSVLFVLISLVVKGGIGIGVSRADGLNQDFNITGAKAEITHETANACLNESISCQTPLFHSDSYAILADLALNPTGDFQSDLNQTIFIALSAGNCMDAINPTFNLTYVAVIPGASLLKHTNKNFTIYTFEGNVPGIAGGTFPLFDHAEFNLKIPTVGSPTLSIAGNANLCPINGPMALSISGNPFGETPSDSDVDFGCVNIPAPEFNTLDISSAFCPIF